MTTTDETAPLLPKSDAPPHTWSKSVLYRVLFTAFLVSLSFGVTQVPIIYVFGLMTCDEYYKTHTDPGTPGRCKLGTIEESTAREVAVMGASTTFCGVFNLFVTGWAIKALGIKKALIMSVLWPALRLVVQNVGVEVGAGMGVIIMQLSQILTVIGGPAGYLLALTSYATEIVEAVDRTATLGRLQGCAMFGTSLGFLAGGLLGENIKLPFRATLILFVISSIWCALALPEIPLNKEVEEKASKSLSAFLDPIYMFTPRKWVLRSGKIQKEYGILLLGIGIFLGVLATSYVPTLLQMYGTYIFDFGTTENGWLIGINSLIRGLFLTFAFPLIIKYGRKWMDRRTKIAKVTCEEAAIHGPLNPDELAPSVATDGQPAQVEAPKVEDKTSFAFDLWFTKYSLLLDGILTGLAVFVSKDWQMFVIAVILPLASGTGSSAKGTILQMCTPEQRTDALSAITLVEMLARLMTTALFGLVFGAFAGMGKAYLIFPCDAAIATLGFIVLLFARFVPDGAERHIEPELSGEAA
ncbi:hypothetical protein AMS68_002663 [Peltaster fructicola]|uniref:Major facilitator superfamily (MFS) profile domain-containing protein n=1 Tax=Peltaster fructicola TaxID=286661 RepID=A0A6H0XR33_9PEZI|nr:hypothetical protein AMS68_002663 [Peltaster fructicola]